MLTRLSADEWLCVCQQMSGGVEGYQAVANAARASRALAATLASARTTLRAHFYRRREADIEWAIRSLCDASLRMYKVSLNTRCGDVSCYSYSSCRQVGVAIAWRCDSPALRQLIDEQYKLGRRSKPSLCYVCHKARERDEATQRRFVCVQCRPRPEAAHDVTRMMNDTSHGWHYEDYDKEEAVVFFAQALRCVIAMNLYGKKPMEQARVLRRVYACADKFATNTRM